MLPGYADCARRAAAKQYRRLIEAAGFELRQLLPSVGAAVGTAVHAALEHALRAKMERGAPATPEEGVAAALGAFREEIGPGAEWDDTTPNLQAAEYQIHRMTAACASLLTELKPAAVELELRAQIDDGWELTGRLDLLEEDGHLDDFKTGALPRPYQAQLGAYSLLARSNGYAVRSAGTTFILREKKTKPQPPPRRQQYDLATAERAAYATIKAVQRDVERFRQSGDPFEFAANPMSLMCSRRYCPAWGTNFCRMHMPAKDNETAVD